MDTDQIIAMSVAAIAEEMKTEVEKVRVISFKEVQKSDLEKYIEAKNISYIKYQLGD